MHGDSSSPKDLGRLFAEALVDAAAPVLVVFDDIHVLAGSRALTAIAELLERAARVGMTFVLCGRSLPIALHSFGAAGSLVQVGAADLAFDEREVRTYFERSESPDAIHATGHWFAKPKAGLGRPRADRFRPRIGGVREPPEALRPPVTTRHAICCSTTWRMKRSLDCRRTNASFCLRRSIMGRIEVGLCDEVLGRTDSDATFAGFVTRGLFVVRCSDEGFSYHQLFQEFLRQTLHRSWPAAQIADLHRRVADRLIARGHAAEAIGHRFVDRAGDARDAVALLEHETIPMLRLGLVSAIGALVNRVASEEVDRNPTLLLALGRVRREQGEWDAALASLERAIGAARSSRAYDAPAEAVRTCATILASRGEFDRFRAMLDEALALGEHLSDESETTLRMTQAAMYVEPIAVKRPWRSSESTGRRSSRAAITSARSVLHNTAVAHLRRGDVFAGFRRCTSERELNLFVWSELRASSLLTLADLVYSHILLGNFDDAERLSDELLTEARDVGNNSIVAHALESRGTIRLNRGDLAGAEAALNEAQRTCDPSDVLVLPDILHGLAQCALARGADADADELCSAAIRIFAGAGRHQQVGPIRLTRAAILERAGRYSAAAAHAFDAADAAGRGSDALLEAMTCLDAAHTLSRLAPHLDAAAAEPVDRRAAQAAANAVGLIHQRDYRFLLRTKAAVFAEMGDALARWGVGASIVEPAGKRAEASADGGLRIEMLGGLRVLAGERPVSDETWKRRRARNIFAYLVSQRGRTIPRARLVDLYWPDADADAGHSSLRVTVTAVRKAVGDVVRFEANGYVFIPPPRTAITSRTSTHASTPHVTPSRAATATKPADPIGAPPTSIAENFSRVWTTAIGNGTSGSACARPAWRRSAGSPSTARVKPPARRSTAC